MNTPIDFQNDMRLLLKNEYDDFIASYEADRFAGLRRNPLKMDKECFEETVPFKLSPVSWADEGYYYDINDRPGKHPLHEAGAYYIQEPSAMSAVAALDPVPGDVVLDLCAAPGGKSTQIAGRLSGEGLLISNEYVHDRSVILSQNIERMGVRNAIVLNESPAHLSGFFPSFFDKILVDAPCSGEGMFRKEEIAVSEWSRDHVTMCARRQREILEEAAKMLKAGGIMVYSTCTFNPCENEGTISEFVKAHPEFSIIQAPVSKYFSQGRPEWVKEPAPGLENAMRLWPHLINGEGHFVVKLQKEGTHEQSSCTNAPLSQSQIKINKDIKDFFKSELSLTETAIEDLVRDTVPVTFGDNIYLVSSKVKSLSGLRVERPGLHVAVNRKNRLEPAHSLALSLCKEDCVSYYEMNEAETEKYLRGETLSCDPSVKGWILMLTNGISIGFGKASNGVIKNHYPKGLRRY